MGRFFKYPLVLMTFFISVSPVPIRDKFAYSKSAPAQPIYIRCATEGPTFWCSSMYLAQQCNTVGYCEENVWNEEAMKKEVAVKHEINFKNDTSFEKPVCTECKRVMADAFFHKGIYEQQIRKVLDDKFCPFFPQLEGVCHKVLNKLFDDIYRNIFLSSTPDLICSKLKVCPAAKGSNEISGKSVANIKQSRFCTQCIYAFYEFDMDLANNWTRQEIKKSLLFLCATATQLIPMGPFICTSLVNKFYDRIYQHMFIDSTPNEMCRELGACPTEDFLHQVPISHVQVTRMCSECQFAMYQFEGFFNNQFLQQHIKDGLLIACAYMNVPIWSVACKIVVNEYYDQFYEHAFIMSTPQQICNEMAMCPPQRKQ